MRALPKYIILGILFPFVELLVTNTFTPSIERNATVHAASELFIVNSSFQIVGAKNGNISASKDAQSPHQITKEFIKTAQKFIENDSVQIARQYLKKAIFHCPENAHNLNATCLNLLGELYIDWKQPDSAQYYLVNNNFWKQGHPIDDEIILKNKYLQALLFVELQRADLATELISSLKSENAIMKYYSNADVDLLIGKTHVIKNNYDSAFHYFHKALLMYDSTYNALGQGRTYKAFGDLLHAFYDNESALEYYFKALENIEPSKFWNETVTINLRIADAYLDLNNYSLAQKYASNACLMAEDKGFKYGIGSSALIKGQLATKNGKFDKAEKELNLANSVFDKQGLNNELLNTQLKQMALFIEMKDVKKAKMLIKDIERHINNIEQPLQLWEYHNILTQYYLMLGDLEKARNSYSNFVNVNLNLSDDRSFKKLIEAHINYRNNVSIYKLQEKQQELSRARAEVKVQQWIINTLIGATLVILIFMIIIFRFYKRNKKANEELVKKNKEIKKHSEELVIAKNKAEESDRLKSAFLTNMSHEIRTPMNSIIGFSKLIGSEDLDENKKQKYINVIESNGRNLVNLIDEIIDLSKLKSQQLKLYPEECVLHKELNTIAKEYKHELVDYGKSHLQIRLLLPNDVQVKTFTADVSRLKQVLCNLLFNAIKFTKQGVIEFGYHFINNQIRFFVQDTGIGIAKHAQDVIFKQFRQVDEGENREYGGTGHGLALCKGLINIMGGDIWYESELHKGTIFYFTIPATNAKFYNNGEVDDFDQESDKAFKWTRKTVLIAEDEEENYILLEEILSETEINIQRAYDGLEAVNIVKGGQPIDVIIMDIKMPVMDGYEATRRIKALNKNIPVIAQTAFALSDEQSQCIEAGCDSYISKPIKSRSLLETMEQFIALSSDKK